MRRFRTIVAIIVSTLLFVSICSTQQTSTTSVPNLIRYGGALKDAQGAALSSSNAVGVTFSIYKEQDGGAAIWTETQNVTPDSNGNYNVLLGSTTATGLPGDLFSQEEQRWLGVQVQGQPEQSRVLLVSVPYAFKAHEAETLAGKSISDFVLAKDLNTTNSVTGTVSNSSSSSTPVASGNGNNKSPSKLQPSTGQTFFSSALNPVVSVMQTGTTVGNNAILATNSNLTSTSNAVTGQISGAGRAIYGQALSTSAQAYGVQGDSASTIGIGLLGVATATTGSTYGLKGYSSSTGGTGVRGLSTATTGVTAGISASVASPSGTAGVFNNTAGGKILSGQNNGAEKFSVDGSGNVNALGTFTGSGTGLTGIQLSQLSGLLASSQFSGTYSNAVTLSNAANLYYGNGGNLTGVMAEPGSPYYIQNGTLQQSSANFSISGSGSANSFISATTYQVVAISGPSPVLSIGNNPADHNLFLGVGTGSGGGGNTFAGDSAGHSNTGGYNNAFYGYQAGYSNSNGAGNTLSGIWAGYSNAQGFANSFYGWEAGYNTNGSEQECCNTFSGGQAGYSNTTGANNTFSGYQAGYNSTGGNNNTFYGYQAGSNNNSGSSDIYIGNQGPSPGSESNAIRIGTQGTAVGQQNAVYIAGIYGSTSSEGIPVYINSTGQLGTLLSSRRFKEQIADMGDNSSRLFQLRPVTFFYKPQYDDGWHTLQYGLIAEEVAEVYPDMVAYDKDGAPYTVKYQYLAPMLLNELQKQHSVVTAQQDVIKTQQEQIQTQGQQIADLQQRLSRLESFIANK